MNMFTYFPWEDEICSNTTRGNSFSALRVSAIKLCYDVNGDGKLDDSEIDLLIKGVTCGAKCPALSTPPSPPSPPSDNDWSTSLIFTDEHLPKMTDFFNGTFKLTKLYSSTGSNATCNQAAFLAAVQNHTNVLTVAKSTNGYVFGGYRSINCNTWGGQPDPKAFIFSINQNWVAYN